MVIGVTAQLEATGEKVHSHDTEDVLSADGSNGQIVGDESGDFICRWISF